MKEQYKVGAIYSNQIREGNHRLVVSITPIDNTVKVVYKYLLEFEGTPKKSDFDDAKENFTYGSVGIAFEQIK